MKVKVLVLLLLVNAVLVAGAESSCSDDGAVKLVGGPNEFEGRVEVCLGGEWRGWCAGGMPVAQGTVETFCRQLQSSATEGLPVTTPLYGTGNLSSGITNVSCDAGQVVTDCTYDFLVDITDCDEVAVLCADPSCVPEDRVRLVGTAASSSEGLVEICSTRGYIAGLCYDEFIQDPEAAAVLCRELGLNTNNPETTDSGLPYVLTFTSYNCNGTEERFSECDGPGAIIATITCSGIRLSCSNVISPTGDLTGISASTPQLMLTTLTNTDVPLISASLVTTILIVVCVVLAACVVLALLAPSLLIIVLSRRRKRRNEVTLHKSENETAELELGPLDDVEYEEIKENSSPVIVSTITGDHLLYAELASRNTIVTGDVTTQSMPTERNVAYGTAPPPPSVPTECNVAYGTAPSPPSVPTECNVAYGTAPPPPPQSVPTECNVAYGTAPSPPSVPTECNVAYGIALPPRSVPTESNVAYGTAPPPPPSSVPTEHN